MEKIKNYLILGMSIALGIIIYLNVTKVIPEPAVITIPASTGTSGVIKKDSIRIDTVQVVKYLPGKVVVKKDIVVDSIYKAKYESALKKNDSLKAKNLFLEAIRINEYNEVAIDNDSIKIDIHAKTRGSLISYKVNYDIKSQRFIYTPEVVRIRPSFTVLTGVELMLPGLAGSNPTDYTAPSIKFDIYVQREKGHMWGVGVDTRGNAYVGYKHVLSFKSNK